MFILQLKYEHFPGLRFRCGGREFSRFHDGLEAVSGVTAVTERFVLRMTAPAKRDDRASSKTKSISSHVLDGDVLSDHAIRTVVEDYDDR